MGLSFVRRADYDLAICGQVVGLLRICFGCHVCQKAIESSQGVSSSIISKLLGAWTTGIEEVYEARLLWAASCLGFFGFMCSGEFTMVDSNSQPAISISDVQVDSHLAPSMVKIHLRRAKTDPSVMG